MYAIRSYYERYIRDIIDPLDEDILEQSCLYQMIKKERPEIIIDSVNTATALAYQRNNFV